MSRTPSLDLAVIGNGALAALLDREGRMVWGCWPRLDGDPIFSALLDGDQEERGLFAIVPDESFTSEQTYLRNTAILRTTVTTRAGAFAVTDFAPLFPVAGRMHRPPMIVRRVEPLSGLCRVRVLLQTDARLWRAPAQTVQGSNHISFSSEGRLLPRHHRRAGLLCRSAAPASS